MGDMNGVMGKEANIEEYDPAQGSAPGRASSAANSGIRGIPGRAVRCGADP